MMDDPVTAAVVVVSAVVLGGLVTAAIAVWRADRRRKTLEADLQARRQYRREADRP